MNSATGIASHTPCIPTICGKIAREIRIKPKVLAKERIAEVFPSDRAVNNPEKYIFVRFFFKCSVYIYRHNLFVKPFICRLYPFNLRHLHALGSVKLPCRRHYYIIYLYVFECIRSFVYYLRIFSPGMNLIREME